jgi:hypothetical protein
MLALQITTGCEEVQARLSEYLDDELEPHDRARAALLVGVEDGREVLADGEARAVEAALHRLHADPEDLRDLRRGEPLHVTQHQHLAVDRLERADRRVQRGAELAARDLLLGAAAVIRDRRGRVRGRVERLDALRGVLAGPALLDAEAPGDRVEPGRHGRGAAELRQRARRREERVLEHVLRVLLLAAQPQPEPEDGALVRAQQALDRCAISAAGGREELLFRVAHAPPVAMTARATARGKGSSPAPRATAAPRSCSGRARSRATA